MSNNRVISNYDSKITGQRLKNLIKESGKSVIDISAALNVSRQNVYNWENGNNIPLEYVFKLSRLFCVSSDYLLGLTNNQSSDIDILTISQKTGLSDIAIENLCKFKEKDFEYIKERGRFYPPCPVVNSELCNFTLAFIDELISSLGYNDFFSKLSKLSEMLQKKNIIDYFSFDSFCAVLSRDIGDSVYNFIFPYFINSYSLKDDK